MEKREDGVLASAPVAPGRSLAELEEAIVSRLDELAELVPDDATDVARAEAIEMQIHDLLSREAEKVDVLARVMERFGNYSSECEAEAQRLNKRSKAFWNKRERLADYVLNVMERWGAKKLEGKLNTFTRIQKPETVEVDDAKELPFEFQRWSFTFTPRSEEELARLNEMLEAYVGSVDLLPRKDALKTELKSESARELPGVRLKSGSWRLAVR
jgi:Gp157 protein